MTSNKIKILVIGESGVGKTSLILRFTENSFHENLSVTIHADIKRKRINIDGDEIMLEIWDTAGQERFNSFTRSYYRDAQGAILIYDVNNRNSFQNLNMWLNELDSNCTETNLQKMVVGNKIDINGSRQISHEAGLKYATERSLLFMETSARTSSSAKEAFEIVARKIVAAGSPQRNANADNPIHLGSGNTNVNVNVRADNNKCDCNFFFK